MKKNWTAIALAIGPAVMIASIFWEYARMNPDYNFLVQPWSIRGFETIHGTIIAVAALLLLVASLLTSTQRVMNRPLYSAFVVGYIVVAATSFTAFFAPGTVTISLGAASSVFLSIILGAAGALMLRSLFGDSVKALSRALLTFLPLSVGLFFLLGATLVDASVPTATWLVIFIIFAGIGSFTLSISPTSMGANRMLIVAAVAGWALVTFSAGAIRQSLVDLQFATDQGGGVFAIAAEYKDTQAAGGWWLAGFGGFIMFIGAVGLWARRRDLVTAIARAKRQRIAAETSAKEIADAAEAYAREHETAATG